MEEERRSQWKAWGLAITLALIAVLFFVLTRTHSLDPGWETLEILSESTPSTPEASSTSLTERTTELASGPFYIVGAVKSPGVYTIEEGLYLYQLIEQAGGLSEEADEESLNLASRLSIGGMIRIPRKGEDRASDEIVTAVNPSVHQDEMQETEKRVALNSASEELLQTIPGIGPATAQAIIQLRDERGGFESLEELMEVTGIKERKFNQMKAYLVLNEGDESP